MEESMRLTPFITMLGVLGEAVVVKLRFFREEMHGLPPSFYKGM
jgi:hypothetical protein